MPWTLYRYILRDLLKLLVLSTIVLVVIISFAVAIKPLADGMLGPIALLKFVGYTTPTVLGFALPFAGAFASTLVFSRLATDNEITACLASGIGYTKIFTPVLALGLALTMGLFFLSNFVVPTFYRFAAQTVQSDVMTGLVARIDDHRTFVMKDRGVAIYADRASMERAPHLPGAAVQPVKLVRLQGVAAVHFGEQGRIQREATAQKANVFLFRHDGNTWITIRLINALFYDATHGAFDSGYARDAPLGPFPLPKPFKDNPKFLSWPQMRAVSADPALNDGVREKMMSLRQALVNAKLRADILAALKTPREARHIAPGLPGEAADNLQTRTSASRAPNAGGARQNPKSGAAARDVADGGVQASAGDFPRQAGSYVHGGGGAGGGGLVLERPNEGHRYVITSPGIVAQKDGIALVGSQGGSVEVVDTGPGNVVRHYEAKSGTLTIADTGFTNQPRIHIELHDVRIHDPRDAAHIAARAAVTLPSMIWPRPVKVDSTDMRQAAAHSQVPAVHDATAALSHAIFALARDIIAQLHVRAASAVACLLLLLLGAVLSTKLVGQMPLIVYLWTFVLAIVTILIINTGGHMASGGHYGLPVALGVLWLGNVMLAVAVGGLYCWVARH